MPTANKCTGVTMPRFIGIHFIKHYKTSYISLIFKTASKKCCLLKVTLSRYFGHTNLNANIIC